MRLFDLLQMVEQGSMVRIIDTERQEIIEGYVENAFGWFTYEDFGLLWCDGKMKPINTENGIMLCFEVLRFEA